MAWLGQPFPHLTKIQNWIKADSLLKTLKNAEKWSLVFECSAKSNVQLKDSFNLFQTCLQSQPFDVSQRISQRQNQALGESGKSGSQQNGAR